MSNKVTKSVSNQKPVGNYTKVTLDTKDLKQEIIIEDSVWKKIRYLCSKISQVEWSGNIFYTVTGWFNTDMTITVKDIYPQAEGSGGYVEFETDDTIVDYIDLHPELEDMRMGLIHSHNNMNVFFSGTDDTELSDNAAHFDIYLSVIVNNKGEVTAKVASVGSKATVYKLKDEEGKMQEIESASAVLFEVSPKVTIQQPEAPPMEASFCTRVEAIMAKRKKGSFISKYTGTKWGDKKYEVAFNKWTMYNILQSLLKLNSVLYSVESTYKAVLEEYKSVRSFEVFLEDSLSYEQTKGSTWACNSIHNWAEVYEFFDILEDEFISPNIYTALEFKTLKPVIDSWVTTLITDRNKDTNLCINKPRTEVRGFNSGVGARDFNNQEYFND